MYEKFFSKQEKIRDSALITASSLFIAGVSIVAENEVNSDLRLTAGLASLVAILSGVKLISYRTSSNKNKG